MNAAMCSTEKAVGERTRIIEKQMIEMLKILKKKCTMVTANSIGSVDVSSVGVDERKSKPTNNEPCRISYKTSFLRTKLF